MTPTQNVKVEDLPEEIKDHEIAEIPSLLLGKKVLIIGLQMLQRL